MIQHCLMVLLKLENRSENLDIYSEVEAGRYSKAENWTAIRGNKTFYTKKTFFLWKLSTIPKIENFSEGFTMHGCNHLSEDFHFHSAWLPWNVITMTYLCKQLSLGYCFFFFSFFRKKLNSRNVYIWQHFDPKNVYMWQYFDPEKSPKICIYGSIFTPKKNTKCVYMAPFLPPKNPNFFACGGLYKKCVYIWDHFDPPKNQNLFCLRRAV